MKLLITGGAGFIGAHVIRGALNRGWDVAVLDAFTYAGHSETLSAVDPDERLTEIVNVDLGNDCVERLTECLREFWFDAIIHLAAESHVDNSIKGPTVFTKSNVLGTHNLIEAVRRAGTPYPAFVHVSTDEVYGSISDDGKDPRESSPLKPTSPYAASKAASEHIVESYRRTYDLPVAVTRCVNNVGPFQHPEKFIPTAIISALHCKDIPLYGGGHQRRSWIPAEAHAEVLLTIARWLPLYRTYGRTFNVGLEGPWKSRSNRGIANWVVGNAGGSSHLTTVEDRLAHDDCYRVDTSLLRNYRFGAATLNPSLWNFDEVMLRTLHWYAENLEWCWAVAPERMRELTGLTGP